MMSSEITLHSLRTDFGRRRFLAMPIAGTIGWSIAGILGWLLPPGPASIALFICVGMIFWLGVLLSQWLGEPIMGRKSSFTELDRLFLLTVLMANLVWAIAIPFYLIDVTSLPLTLGILSGLMWVPFSWMIQHWVGLFHGVARTVLVVATWFLFPAHRFVAIPAVIVLVYVISIITLARRRLPASRTATN
jgi:hypothetical protein